MQVWVGLPEDKEDVAPLFQNYKKHEIPKAELNGIDITVVAGKFMDYESPVAIFSELIYLDLESDENKKFSHTFNENMDLAVYVLKGNVGVCGEMYERGDLIYELNGKIDLEFTNQSRVILFGGESFNKRKHIWWNFASFSNEKIEDAKLRWKNMEFTPVVDETEYIPLPDK